MRKKQALVMILIALLIFLMTYFAVLFTHTPLELSGPMMRSIYIGRVIEGESSTLFIGEYEEKPIRFTKYRGIDRSQAQEIIENKGYLISSLFESVDSPYPGLLSNSIRCSDEFKPVRVSHAPFDYWKLYATERFTYGACSWDLLFYRTIMYFQQCNDVLYQIELFVPLDEYSNVYENLVPQTQCK